MSGSGVYYASYDLLGDRDLGSHEQVRYVQGDAEELFLRHGSTWHRLPRGGIVAGARGEMTLRSPFTHRAVNVTLEFGRRQVDGHADLPSYAREQDAFYYYVSLPQDSNNTKTLYLLPPDGEQIEVDITQRPNLGISIITNPEVLTFTAASNSQVVRSYGYGHLKAPDLFYTAPSNNLGRYIPLKIQSIEGFSAPVPYLVAPRTALQIRAFAVPDNSDFLSDPQLNLVKVRLLGRLKP